MNVGSHCPYQRLEQAQVCARDRLLMVKVEIAVRCSGVGGEEVGVMCGCMQGCCVGAKPGVSS